MKNNDINASTEVFMPNGKDQQLLFWQKNVKVIIEQQNCPIATDERKLFERSIKLLNWKY